MSNLPTVQSDKFTSAEIDLLRTTYAKGLSDAETSLFLKQAEAMNLNPFTKEIYGMSISNRLVLITSIAGLRKIAHASGNYVGCDVRVAYDDKGNPVSASATVKKLVSGVVAEFTSEVMFDEYNTGKNNWANMPITMIKKVAEAHALRMAYPSAENLYDESELGAIKASKRESERASSLTEKFTQLPAREVAPHPEAEVVVEKTDGLGDFLIPIGKYTGKKLNEVPKDDVLKFLDWFETQEDSKLTPGAKAYYSAARAYVGGKEKV